MGLLDNIVSKVIIKSAKKAVPKVSKKAIRKVSNLNLVPRNPNGTFAPFGKIMGFAKNIYAHGFVHGALTVTGIAFIGSKIRKSIKNKKKRKQNDDDEIEEEC